MSLTLPPKSQKRRSESTLVAEIRLALGKLPWVWITRNNNLGPVVPWAKRLDPGARPVVSGLGRGSPDLVGMVDGGRVFCLEVKTDTGRTSPEQDFWIAEVNRRGGYAAVVRSVEEALAAASGAARGGRSNIG